MQSVSVDKTILWIAEEDMSSLPYSVSSLQEHGLEIRPCQNFLSFKKLIPALQEFPSATIITADDDVYYPNSWVDSMIANYNEAEPAIIGGRVHLARFDAEGDAFSYSDWLHDVVPNFPLESNTALFPTGVAGVLYPPKSLAPEVIDAASFMTLCPHADDIWLFWMAKRAGTRHIKARDPFKVIAWDSSQDTALYQQNVFGRGNDMQIQALERAFGSALSQEQSR